MPQSLSSLLIHLIFSTKDRYPFLAQNDLLLRTHAYLGGILRESDCPSLTIGGTADHVHMEGWRLIHRRDLVRTLVGRRLTGGVLSDC